MYRPLAHSHRRPQRRGTSFVLIVVVWISLFAVVGTGFALYAIQQARYNSSWKDAAGGGSIPPLTPPDPTNTVNAFFGGLICDVADGNATTTDLTNALRGHSIARSMYGRDVFALNNNLPLTTPWNGIGLFHEDGGTYNPALAGQDRARFVNNTLMSIGASPLLLDPEYIGARAIPAAGPIPPFDPTTRTYISKAAGYSYPDLKDFFAGAIDPATGQVLTQSFYRAWSFGPLDPTNGGVAAANNNWTNATGQLYILRPRPAEHPNFPRVGPDADGTYRGDVQNWPGGYAYNSTTGQYYAQNDSLWMNIGLPTITLPGGKVVQPMVAPLIVPVNGLLNASAHGNTYYGGVHGSHAGYGPWEVNLGYLLTTPGSAGPPATPSEAANVVNGRGNGSNQWQQRIALNAPPAGTTRPYSPYATGPQPDYAPVAWNNQSIAYPAYPSGGSIAGLPNFNVPAAFQNQNQAAQYHPSLFNPNEWLGTSALSFRTFMTNDLKYMNRYAFTPDWYSQSSVTPFAPIGLKGSYAFTFATGQATPNSYRLDPAHPNRALLTPRGYNLDRPKSVPNFFNRDTTALQYNTNVNAPNKPGIVLQGMYPSPATAGTTGTLVTDFTSQTRWSNAMAALGSVNLNRQLADYRVNTSLPLSSPGNVTAVSAAQADTDRQQLATDIFVRLVASLGAAATVNPNYTTYVPGTPTGPYTILPTATVGTPQYNALRYIAQLSVNIVDYIDNDDISTVFNWNPADPTSGTVYGVEKPRLVINEAYSEITNDPSNMVPTLLMGVPQPLPAGANANVRFWLELVNPTATLSQPTGPLADGSVPLSAYRVEIARAIRTTGVAGGPFNLVNYLSDPANTTGSFATGQTADIAFNLNQLAGASSVSPNNAAYNPNGLPASGMLLLGPKLTTPKTIEFNPDTTQQPWSNAQLVGAPNNTPTAAPGSNSMAYTLTMPAVATLSNSEFRRNVVLLRRLANPYVAAGPTNPYITVDVMDYVPSFDSVTAAAGQANPRVAWVTAGDGGYDPMAKRFSVGKVQPYAGHSISTTGGALGASNQPGVFNTYTFGNANPALSSMVLNQTAASNNNSSNGMGGQPGPMSTFGTHNGATGAQPGVSTYNYIAPGPPSLKGAAGAETIMTPFDWYVHMDRPLVNQIELFAVRDTPAHRVTDQFVLASTNVNSASGLSYASGVGRWRYTYDGLARALEYLTVKPYTTGVPYGGRLPGQINVNAVQDQRVINGLFDPYNPPQPVTPPNPPNGPAANALLGNGFDINFVDSAPTGPWQGWMATRSGLATSTLPNSGTFPVTAAPGQTVQDTNVWAAGTNRPFLPFGAPAIDPGSQFAYGATGISGAGPMDYNILRADTQTAPYLYANAGSATSNLNVQFPPTHPNGAQYYQTEPVRKILNNTTTVNHQYVVFLTIGYFDVDTTLPPLAVGPGVTIPRLGAETFINVPGDMRQKFVALVDMSNMALNPTSNTLANVQPFFTSLESTTYAAASATLNVSYSSFDSTNNILYVAADGQQVAISPTQNSTLVIGYGTEQQIVTVTGVGQGTITVTGMTRTAWSGACVSNVRPGYPGPQPGFNAVAQPVLPYIERLK